MAFVQVNIKVAPGFVEIFIAELGELSFDTFEEDESGVNAYIEQVFFSEEKIKSLIQKYADATSASYSIQTIEKENWNEAWEKNYDAIEVGDKCRVRAIFHPPDPAFRYEIVINPKMSFGTGHHATTWQMLQLEMEGDMQHKHVLDVGTGTGVLAIMAVKLGAASIEATDIDDWCIENSLENFGLNNIEAPVHLGDIFTTTLLRNSFDIILANINKNVLLKEMPEYSKLLVPGGQLFLSGFYEQDAEDIQNHAARYNLSLTKSVSKERWAAMVLTKSA